MTKWAASLVRMALVFGVFLTDLIESICEENSKDVPHMVGK